MAQPQEIATLFPLVVGIGTIVITIGIHALALNSIVHFLRHERKIGFTGQQFIKDLAIVIIVILIALVAHLIEISVWACVLEACGEFVDLSAAFYHSATNYTTLGYGDVVMSKSWKLLGPLEATDGMLMFGISTAMVFAIIQRFITTRFEDLRN